MALIGKKKPAARPVFDEPAPTIDAPAPQVDTSAADVTQSVPKIRHGLFGSGITGKDVLRTAGDILQFGPFAPLARERINNYREDRAALNNYRNAQAEYYRERPTAAAAPAQRGRLFQRRDGSFVRENLETGDLELVTGLPEIEMPEPLVRTYDPQSPTGEVFTPRSAAAGQPAGAPPKAPAAPKPSTRAFTAYARNAEGKLMGFDGRQWVDAN